MAERCPKPEGAVTAAVKVGTRLCTLHRDEHTQAVVMTRPGWHERARCISGWKVIFSQVSSAFLVCSVPVINCSVPIRTDGLC